MRFVFFSSLRALLGVGKSLDVEQGRNKQAVFSGKHQMVYLHHPVVVHNMNKLCYFWTHSVSYYIDRQECGFM